MKLSKLLITLSLTLILTLLTSSTINAASSTNKVSLTITKITYSQEDHTYYAYTEADKDEGSWVIDIDPEGLSLKQMKKKYIKHIIDIYYTGDVQTDEEIEIIKTVIR